jgi:phenylalanyl-tRNA synthetase beta chain
LKALKYNLNRNAVNLKFFEIGHVFRKSEQGSWIEGVREHTNLLLGLCGNRKEDNWQGDNVPYSQYSI